MTGYVGSTDRTPLVAILKLKNRMKTVELVGNNTVPSSF